MSIGFRPTAADSEMIQAHKRPDESTSDVLRRALRALDREKWQVEARKDMERIAASGEDLSEEPDDWGFDGDGQPVDLRGDGPLNVDVPADEPQRPGDARATEQLGRDVVAEVYQELRRKIEADQVFTGKGVAVVRDSLEMSTQLIQKFEGMLANTSPILASRPSERDHPVPRKLAQLHAARRRAGKR